MLHRLAHSRWQEGATNTAGLQLTGRHTAGLKLTGTYTAGLQLTGRHTVDRQEGVTHTAGLQLTGGQDGWQGLGTQAAWQPEEQLVWHMVAWGWLVSGGRRVMSAGCLPGQPLYPGRAERGPGGAGRGEA